METIVFIDGKVKFPITIDPGVWIFDDRKIDLDTYFKEGPKTETDTYTKEVSEHWDRERMEGARVPSKSNDNKIHYDKMQLFSKSYGIPLSPFILNAQPEQKASHVIIGTKDGTEIKISVSEAKSAILGFSTNGKPVKDGPVHFYYGDGSNQSKPIHSITRFTLV
ncbi:peptidyl-prolyl cis-trans isomerase [Alkalihalobacillus sp. AL-G]|uniref:peptidyl-prolyl cis-trans isomerase n=1 Tax=Alkalihalobacillus sp. AL-G TaxID=2926399 RepID=UPI00272ABC99|nr:peptidyl-prolyl cis-trans isomerase [Alkalihalobacillus sp. AL-G]WLD95020.1 peptidyl-prolyl cis-trans isomerase [Alkalihalobacillus sp. AL-G]